jgi:hypothetical protein
MERPRGIKEGGTELGYTTTQIEAELKVVTLANEMLSGNLCYIAGARALVALRSALGISDHDPDFLTFVAIDSETDALPINEAARRLWSPLAFKKLESEIADAEKWAHEIGEPVCRALIVRFDIHKSPSP